MNKPEQEPVTPPDHNSLPPLDRASSNQSPVYSLTVALDDRLISGQTVSRWHYRKRNNHFRRIHSDVGWLIPRKHQPPKPLLRATVDVHAYLPQPLDLDNLYSGAKPYIDALTRSAIIRDDSERYIDLKVHQSANSVSAVVISVTELPAV